MVVSLSSILSEVSKEIGVSKDDILSKGLRAYLRTELGKVETELFSIYHKYGIKSIHDLEHSIEKGEVSESDVLDDLTKVDYLESRRDKLKNLLVRAG